MKNKSNRISKKINRMSTTIWMTVMQSLSLIVCSVSLMLMIANKGGMNKEMGQLPFNMSFLYESHSSSLNENYASNLYGDGPSAIPFSVGMLIKILQEVHKKGLIPSDLYKEIGIYLLFWCCFSWAVIVLISIVYYRSYRKTRRIRVRKNIKQY